MLESPKLEMNCSEIKAGQVHYKNLAIQQVKGEVQMYLYMYSGEPIHTIKFIVSKNHLHQ
jgi:hypothetical protein